MLRATVLHRLADAYEARAGDLVDTLCLENGKLRGEAATRCTSSPGRCGSRPGWPSTASAG